MALLAQSRSVWRSVWCYSWVYTRLGLVWLETTKLPIRCEHDHETSGNLSRMYPWMAWQTAGTLQMFKKSSTFKCWWLNTNPNHGAFFKHDWSSASFCFWTTLAQLGDITFSNCTTNNKLNYSNKTFLVNCNKPCTNTRQVFPTVPLCALGLVFPGFSQKPDTYSLSSMLKYFIETADFQKCDARTLGGTDILSHEQMI